MILRTKCFLIYIYIPPGQNGILRDRSGPVNTGPATATECEPDRFTRRERLICRPRVKSRGSFVLWETINRVVVSRVGGNLRTVADRRNRRGRRDKR